MTVLWKPRSCGRTESFPKLYDTASFFPGFTWEDVNLTEEVNIELDIQVPETWARQIPLQAAMLAELFMARGYRLVGVARVDACDKWRPVWAALLKEWKT